MRRRSHRFGVALLAALLPVAVLLPRAAVADSGSADRAAAFEDENMMKAALMRVNAQHFRGARINVDAFHRRLLLTGEVPDNAVRNQAEQAVSTIPNVDGVANELVVGPVIGISTRTSDSWVTSDVKFGLLKKGFGRDRIRVVTEDGTVYLMGKLTRKDGATAAEIASTTDHVQRVVLVFEYLD